ncbi:MAG: iron-containing redox enzyme family protein [Planctomycetes bacterium]|nr:iron-containing redox enzyme family protein [Planctomycetota bacterium]
MKANDPPATKRPPVSAWQSAFSTSYDFSRREPYDPGTFLGLVREITEKYFYGFYHPLGRRLIAGDLSPEDLRFLAMQEHAYYAGTTWWNAGKLLRANTLAEQRQLFAPLLDELGTDLVDDGGLPAHSELFVRYCEGLGVTREELDRAPLAPGVVLAVTELRRIATERPAFEFIAASNLVVEKMRAKHYAALLETFATSYRWVPKSALLFYEIHARLDDGHGSLGEAFVARYAHDKRDQDAIFSAVQRSLCLRLAMYDSIASAMQSPGGVGLVPWPNFPGEPWPRPAS